MINKQQIKQLQSLVIFVLLLASNVYAQVPPVDKYDTSSYPQDRKAIELLSRKNDSTKFNNDDYIAVDLEA